MTRGRRDPPDVPETRPEAPPGAAPETPSVHPGTSPAEPAAATPAEPARAEPAAGTPGKPAATAPHPSAAPADAPQPAPETLPETPPEAAIEPEPPEPSPQRGRGGAVWLALALVLVIVLVLASPFWASAVAPLLPWGETPAGEVRVTGSAAGSGVDRDVLARLDRIEAAQRAERSPPPAPPGPDLKPALDRLDKRLGALEARPAPPPPSDLSDIRQQLGTLAAAVGDLAGRLGALEKTVKAEPASDPVDAALALTLLQIREAVDAARPFAAEYETLVGLARNRPELEAAVAPLAGPAKTGVASRAVLARRLHELAGQIAGAEPPPAADDWGGQILARLRSLVTVRRVAGPGLSTPEAAVSQAERATAQGDLAGAVAALDRLEGAPAEAAQPWLRMARARLQVEAAVRQVETALAARLKTAAQPAEQPR